MSEPSKIILKVNKTDLGKNVKFDPKKLPIKLETWDFGEACDEKSQEVELNGNYIGVYCHWDGSNVIETLREIFNDYDSALNLIIGGDMSGVDSNGLRHYANRSIEAWEHIKPKQGKLNVVSKKIYGLYSYLFVNGKWKCLKKC